MLSSMFVMYMLSSFLALRFPVAYAMSCIDTVAGMKRTLAFTLIIDTRVDCPERPGVRVSGLSAMDRAKKWTAQPQQASCCGRLF
jgi:hypothetical protein